MRSRSIREIKLPKRGPKSLLGLELARLKPGQSVLITAKQLELKETDAPNQPLLRLRSQVSSFNRQFLLTEEGNKISIRKYRLGIPNKHGVRIVRLW